MSNSSVLFSPARLGALELPNRVLMAPMTRSRATEKGVPTPLMATYYAQRASAGLILTEATAVSQQGTGYTNIPGMYSEEQVAGWRQVTDAVHAAGGRIFIQLFHMGRISHQNFQPNGELPVAPSAIAAEGQLYSYQGPVDMPTPRALETSEISGIVAQFAHAARLAKLAGFDGVEVHGANGYLLDQFLRDGSNQRTDSYGGSKENRARLLLEVTRAIVEVWGADRVGVRLSPTNPYNSMSDSNPEETFGYAAAELAKLNPAYLHVITPMSADVKPEAQPMLNVIRNNYKSTLIANGSFGKDAAEAVIATGKADFVAFGAPFISNPDLPYRLLVNAELAQPDVNTFYQGGEKGYTDYPALSVASATR